MHSNLRCCCSNCFKVESVVTKTKKNSKRAKKADGGIIHENLTYVFEVKPTKVKDKKKQELGFEKVITALKTVTNNKPGYCALGMTCFRKICLKIRKLER